MGNKEKIIENIKCRIQSEHRKHSSLDWEMIAARKIYAEFLFLNISGNIPKTEFCDCENPEEIMTIDCEFYCEKCKKPIHR